MTAQNAFYLACVAVGGLVAWSVVSSILDVIEAAEAAARVLAARRVGF